jgi:cytochrome c peroxidase
MIKFSKIERALSLTFLFACVACGGLSRSSDSNARQWPAAAPAGTGEQIPAQSPREFDDRILPAVASVHPCAAAVVGGDEINALRTCLNEQGVEPLRDADFRKASQAKIKLGRFLFFDRILSGNQQVACSSCHAPRRSTSDLASMPPQAGSEGRIQLFLFSKFTTTLPRNAVALFNRGHASYTAMFHDSRVHVDPSQPSGFATPAGLELPLGLDSVLAAQAMFPVLEPTEMLGDPGQNDLAGLTSKTAIWRGLAQRLLAIPEYRSLFIEAYPTVPLGAIGFQHAANALGAFQEDFWRADKSPFDRFLNGDNTALSSLAVRGAGLFYGRAGCSGCHGGALQTDQDHHAVAFPQFGPGKGDGPSGRDDFGLERTTGDPADRYKFKTPSLRNVTLTGPWGHDGAYADLRSVVAHFRDPIQAMHHWDYNQVEIIGVGYPHDHFDSYFDPQIRHAVALANEASPVPLSNPDIDAILAFFDALTDRTVLNRLHEIPFKVPSGRRDLVSLLPDILFDANSGLDVGPLFPLRVDYRLLIDPVYSLLLSSLDH